MLKYLIIPLTNDSVSFCQYIRGTNSNELISIELLQKAILWAMKENLTIQVLYPNFIIPNEYKKILDSIEHADIVGSDCKDKSLLQAADVVVYDNWEKTEDLLSTNNSGHVIQTSKKDLFLNKDKLINLISKSKRLIINITDIDNFNDQDFKQYKDLLDCLIPLITKEYVNAHAVQLNLLTDRMLLSNMNNCNAGVETITLAPNGNFYICPAFYLDGSKSVGNLNDGLCINNAPLFNINHAPICRNCDAYQCRRCVWLNKRTTHEVNTPSHEQCVISHIERNASKKLLDSIREWGQFLPDTTITNIDYLDPFEKIYQN